jgi:hypothetical protein
MSGLLALLVGVLSGCGEAQPPPLEVPTLAVPTLGIPPGTSAPVPAPQPDNARANYPLSYAQAYQLASGGTAVVGSFAAGEVEVRPLPVTEWKETMVNKQVCKDRWDSLEGAYKYTCQFENVPDRRQVTSVKYYVSGPGMTTLAYDTVNQAFATIAPTDLWRLS